MCLDKQCRNGERCEIIRSDLDELIPSCSCDSITDHNRLPYIFGCKKADDGTRNDLMFSNKEDVRKTLCEEKLTITFVNTCKEKGFCDEIGGCDGVGEICVSVDTSPKCVCISCDQDKYNPVCADNGETFRFEIFFRFFYLIFLLMFLKHNFIKLFK